MFRYISLFIFLVVGFQAPLWACESCTIPNMGRHQAADSRVAVDMRFEQHNWDQIPAREAHRLHHDGHHYHNKVHEEFYTTALRTSLSDAVEMVVEIPFVEKSFTEIDDHARLGARQTTSGLGDITVLAVWKFLREQGKTLGLFSGVKLATGETKELTTQGTLAEPEMQPGTGSTDFPLGLIYQGEALGTEYRGNISYVIKQEGSQEFEAGDVFLVSAFLRRSVLNDRLKLGADAQFQWEARQHLNGVTVHDSGGRTLLLGPAISYQITENAVIEASILLPAYQSLGGVHQELDYTWHWSCSVHW